MCYVFFLCFWTTRCDLDYCMHLTVGRCSDVNCQTAETDSILASCSTDITCFNITKINVNTNTEQRQLIT